MNLIMFDMDGTLFRTETSFFPSVREFASRHAFPVPDEAFLRSFIGQSGSEWRAWLEQLQLGTPTQELASEFDLLEQEYVKTQGELYPGTTDVLRALALDGWKLGVCSNAPGWYPETILTRAGVRDLFSMVRVPSRPDQTKTMMLCDVWNELHPERCAMVGDRADDMQAAYAGGYFAIGAAYGWAPEELELADVRIHDIAEIPMALALHWLPGNEPAIARPPVFVAPAPVVSAAPAPVILEVLVPQTSASQAPPAPSRVQEPVAAEPIVSAVMPEEAVAPVVNAPVSMPPVEAAPPLHAPVAVVEPVAPVYPVAPQVQPSPEPPSAAPAVTTPVKPVAMPPVPEPQRTKPEPFTPRPAEPTLAPAERRSWNPFRRHEDKPR
ncbi:MAG: HAD hydrolase-like protein [Caldiserica bacterium]|nr:HAD hydrolase-like protein [Caldisericota bacterium]